MQRIRTDSRGEGGTADYEQLLPQHEMSKVSYWLLLLNSKPITRKGSAQRGMSPWLLSKSLLKLIHELQLNDWYVHLDLLTSLCVAKLLTQSVNICKHTTLCGVQRQDKYLFYPAAYYLTTFYESVYLTLGFFITYLDHLPQIHCWLHEKLAIQEDDLKSPKEVHKIICILHVQKN